MCHREPPEPCSDGPPAVPKASELQPELSARPRAGEQRRWKPREPAVTPLLRARGTGGAAAHGWGGSRVLPRPARGVWVPGEGMSGRVGGCGWPCWRHIPLSSPAGPFPGDMWCQGCSLGALQLPGAAVGPAGV